MKRLSRVVCAALMCMGIASTAIAGNVDTYGIGAKETAVAGAYAAWADDPFALYYNPAGLVQVKRPTITIGFQNIKPVLKADDVEVTDPKHRAVLFGRNGFTDSSRALFVPNLGAAIPLFEGRLVLAAGSFVPFGLKISWNNDIHNTIAFNSYKSWYYRKVFAVGAGYRVLDNLFIGGAFEFGSSFSGVQRLDYATYRTTGVVVAVKSDLHDYRNYSWNVGIMYKPFKWLTFGATYRSMTHTHFKGDLEVDSANPAVIPDQKVDAKTSIDHPEQIQIGLNIKPWDRLTFEIDYLWTRWDRIEGYKVSFDKPLLKLGPNGPEYIKSEYFPRDWNNTNVFKFGAEYRPFDILALRAGFYYDPTPIPANTFDIPWPDANKYMYTWGAGVKIGKHIKLDVDGFYGQSRGERDIQNTKNLDETYVAPGISDPYVKLGAKGHLWGFGANITYTF